jgi:hypothetical protein
MANVIATGAVVQTFPDVGQVVVQLDGTTTETYYTPTNGIDPAIIPGSSRVQIFDDGSVTVPHTTSIPDA